VLMSEKVVYAFHGKNGRHCPIRGEKKGDDSSSSGEGEKKRGSKGLESY